MRISLGLRQLLVSCCLLSLVPFASLETQHAQTTSTVESSTYIDHGNYESKTELKDLWYSSFEEYQRLTEPVFDNNTLVNHTVQLGGTAYLPCRVRNLGERTITWVRRRDWHILTSGLLTYTNDERFQVLHPENTDDWTLQVKYVQKRDNGTYECQVATTSGIMSHFVNLDIVIPEAFIVGATEHHVVLGSYIRLVCVIEKSPTPPQYVMWYHNDRMISYDKGRIEVRTEQGQKTESHLLIHDARYSDSGNYSCSASNTQPAHIHLFVSEGDKMAAISRRKSSSTHSHAQASLILSVILLLISS